ncbi:MAG: radical SAM family heme chaperone HemW [Clostridia bacterium]|nr:radical SAM family heme chaperone HemW [Clostridia bacterium]
MDPIGLYLHVPFCATRCPYCDFFTQRPVGDARTVYAETMKTELRDTRDKTIRADSVYFGGGTPSVLPGDVFTDLLGTVRDCFTVTPDAEITVECNPSSDLEHFLPAAAEAGVNRVSLGMQSAVDAERRKLGRTSDRKRVEEALRIARTCGIDNLTLDVMLGVPGQTLQSLGETLRFLVDSGVPHVSAYMLKLEEGTVFWKRADTLDLPGEDLVGDMYLQTIETLEAAGLKQYEISNFARPGFESRHNLKYWHCEEYLGFGPSAHSYFRGERFYRKPDWEAFVAGDPVVPDGPGGSFEERLMLALRLTEGYRGEIPPELREKASQPLLKPFVEVGDDFVRLTKEGFLVSNTVIAELL